MHSFFGSKKSWVRFKNTQQTQARSYANCDNFQQNNKSDTKVTQNYYNTNTKVTQN